MFGVFKNVAAAHAMRDLLLEHAALLDFDVVIGLDSRGFLLGPLISLKLNKPFIPIRKKGKLPGKVLSQSFTLEYGEVVKRFTIYKIIERKQINNYFFPIIIFPGYI